MISKIVVAMKFGLVACLLSIFACTIHAAQRDVKSDQPAASPSDQPAPTTQGPATPGPDPIATVEDSEKTKSDVAENQPSHDSARRNMLFASLTIFVLAIFVGFEIITKVPPTLHTPLMSGSNAISGITIVGALLIAGHAGGFFASSLGFFAVALATVNVVGGFLVTHRMLAMFKKR